MPSIAREQVCREMRRHRAQVLLRWRQRIGDEIPVSATLPEALLFDTMPELYDYLTLSIADPDGLGRSSIARAHGADRARQGSYRPCDLLREFQVLRRSMREIAAEHDLALTHEHMAALSASFDAVECDALEEFHLVQRREQDMTLQVLATELREHMNVIGIAAVRIVGTTRLDRIAELAHRISTRLSRIETALCDSERHGTADSGQLPLLLSTFDLAALAREACRDAGHAGSLVDGGPVQVTWCRMSVRQALRNLLAESRDPAGPVSVGVRHANGRAIVSVLHRHVLSADIVRTLFSTRNKEAHPTLREWGVGLAFVRDVAESHGGSAIVTSSAATGTTFQLDMPLDASPFITSPAIAGASMAHPAGIP